MPHHDDPPERNPFAPNEQPILPGLVVVPQPSVDEAKSVLEGRAVERSRDQLIADHLVLPDQDDPDTGHSEDGGLIALAEGDLAALDDILTRVRYLDLRDARTPRNTIDEVVLLREAGIDARPMFYCWTLNHWDAQPGETKQLLNVNLRFPSIAPGRNGAAASPVWVIDTGYDTKNAWYQDLLQNPVAVDDPGGGPDRDHGTFVAALIGAISPESTVKLLRTGFRHRPHKTDELAVGVKLGRAVYEYAVGQHPAGGVINLSLGTYAAYIRRVAGPDEVLDPLTLDTQLQVASGYPSLRVVASAGNEWSHVNQAEIAYPASSKHAIAVGAGYAEDDKTPMRWTSWVGAGRQQRTAPAPNPNTAVLAPGVDLRGPVSGGGFAEWSGSSFAAALYSGYLAAYGQPPATNTKADYRVFENQDQTTIIP